MSERNGTYLETILIPISMKTPMRLGLALLAAIALATPAAAQFQTQTDAYEAVHDQVFDSGLQSVLDNDPVLPPGRLVVRVTRDPAHGQLDMADDGTFVYTPDPGYVGDDSFEYVVELRPLQELTFVAGAAIDVDASVTVSLLGTGSDQANVPITGTVWADVGINGDPITDVRIVGLEATNQNAVNLKLDYGSPFTLGSLIIDIDPDSLGLMLNAAGPMVPTSGVLGAFNQTGNKLGVDAVVKLTGTGLLAGQVPADPQNLVTETDFDLTGFILNQAGTVTLILNVNSQNSFDLDGNAADMLITGQISATGPYLAGAASAPETVNMNVTSPTAIAENEQPGPFRLTGIYPNPVTTRATIEYELMRAGPVTIAVYDVLGREVDTIRAGTNGIGRRRVTWDASRLPGGIYILRMTTGPFTETRALVVR